MSLSVLYLFFSEHVPIRENISEFFKITFSGSLLSVENFFWWQVWGLSGNRFGIGTRQRSFKTMIGE